MRNHRFKRIKNNKRIFYISSICLVLIAIGIINVAYSKYGSEFEVSINTPSGEMIIDATIDANEEYLENGLRYFLITLTNKKDDKVTSTNIDYKLTITNQEGYSNGRFHYIDSNGNTNPELIAFQKELIIDNYSFSTEEEQMIFKIYTMVDSGLTEDVKYQITVDAIQKEMTLNE